MYKATLTRTYSFWGITNIYIYTYLYSNEAIQQREVLYDNYNTTGW